MTKATTIYGIKNCDTMKKARAWLEKHGVEYAFHDYKTAGIERERLARREYRLLRALAELGRRDRDPGDAVVDSPVLQVGGQRARGEDDDYPGGNPAQDVPLTCARPSPHA